MSTKKVSASQSRRLKVQSEGVGSKKKLTPKQKKQTLEQYEIAMRGQKTLIAELTDKLNDERQTSAAFEESVQALKDMHDSATRQINTFRSKISTQKAWLWVLSIALIIAIIWF